MSKLFKILLIVAIVIFGVLLCLFLIPVPQAKTVLWGVDFSQMQAEGLKLDWKKMYLAMLEDLGVKHIKLHTQWDFIEGSQGTVYFNDVDWQLQQAQSHGADVIYVIGMKTGRWPECHTPSWAAGLSEQEQQKDVLAYVQMVVERYKDNKAIVAWQAENEPLFGFGICPSWYYQNTDFLKQEVALIHSLDPSRQVIISDSGESSLWLRAASIGDEVSSTLYRKVWMHISDTLGFYWTWPIPPSWYWVKASIIQAFFHKKVIVGELQAEPWNPSPFNNLPLQEQEQSMNLSQLTANITYAKKTGLDGFYLWGVEWWYWLKTTQNEPGIWNYAKTLFKTP